MPRSIALCLFPPALLLTRIQKTKRDDPASIVVSGTKAYVNGTPTSVPGVFSVGSTGVNGPFTTGSNVISVSGTKVWINGTPTSGANAISVSGTNVELNGTPTSGVSGSPPTNAAGKGIAADMGMLAGAAAVVAVAL
jgi:hypothetical protein